MKKFLTVLACLLTFGVIVTLCYFFGSPRYEIAMPDGKYFLVSLQEGFEGKEGTETEYNSDTLYLEVNGKTIKSYSGEIGLVESDTIYSYKVVGTGLEIKEDEKTVYSGIYTEDLIVIIIEEKKEVDGEQKSYQYQYFYVLATN